MVLVIYDIAKQPSRQRVERVLREASFIFLFRNARWTNRPQDIGALRRRLMAQLHRQAFRVLIIEMPQRSRDGARWLHGSVSKATR